MLIREERRLRDVGKNNRGWYVRDNEWTRGAGTEKDDLKSEYRESLWKVSIDTCTCSINVMYM